ncbi:YgjV family protein [Shewanella sp. D64]|uniref:YgjV family protein n=1 Tax=unclassified Shewanella TaxID=196818 RepID=UPI0022BA5F0E|nr:MULTISPECIES: YgjV family protein [unclassified Shewanella]MEC4726404.1 YgjV family protein [Shewanella sp. D64]MEC4738416.1 YgjV family protein [Shewanella sp. E94]WBJ98240.1 YgjV family protein [Shewanella sp. MTB7]
MFDVIHHALAQGIGFISMFIAWWANAQKKDQKLLTGNIVAASLTSIHLGLLGSTLGMANQLLNMGRFYSGRCCRLPILAPIFASLAILLGWFWAQHWSEWCAVFAAVIMSFALIHTSGIQLRLAMLVSNICNLSLSLHLNSWSGILYQVITIAIIGYQIRESLRPQQFISEIP